MRISSINAGNTVNRIPHINNTREVNTSNNKDIRESLSILKYGNINFSGHSKRGGINYKLRRGQLKELGIKKEYIDKISKYPQDRYDKALSLLEAGCYEECVGYMSELPAKRYRMAMNLVEHNVIDETLYPLVELNKRRYKRVIDLKDKGIDAKDLEIFAQLEPKQFEKAKKMMLRGYYPIDAAYLSTLTPEQRKIAKEMLKRDIDIEIAAHIASKKPEEQNNFTDLLNSGLSPNNAEDISELTKEQQEEAKRLIELGIGDDNAADIAQLNEIQRIKAQLMLEDGVHPDYIEGIIKEEEKEDKTFAYNEYRKRGYSKTSSYSISLLSDKEIDLLIRVMDNNPLLKDLYKEEYEVRVINLQDSKLPSAILTKQKRNEDGTTIKFIHVFDAKGNHSSSRLEEYPNHATSSTLKDGSDVFRIKYDKSGDIKEMIEFIQAPDTREVIGVLHSTASKTLLGAFETVYYDINDFKTDSRNEACADNGIKDAVKNGGIPISTVTKDKDGKITFTEKFNFNGIKTAREYTEKKDRKGNITESSYSINIKDEKGKNILDTSRSYKKINENNTVNVINGITYNLQFNDSDKSITVSDGSNTRKLDFNNKLATYSKEKIWETAKQLPVDTLITIHDNIKQWNYCRTENSIADGYCDILSTGDCTSVIEHEAGHFKDYEIESISNDKTFKEVYSKEMAFFAKNIPYNEFDFITYLSPRADLIEVSGRSEFVAESNIILTTFGTNTNKLKTRSQFLARYFPKSIAKVAELSGKTSTKSLLEK